MVTIRLFATLRDLTGDSEIQLELDQPARVEDLFARLAARTPGLEAYRGSLLIAVNEEYGRWDTMVSDGDELAFFPPVSGGRP